MIAMTYAVRLTELGVRIGAVEEKQSKEILDSAFFGGIKTKMNQFQHTLKEFTGVTFRK